MVTDLRPAAQPVALDPHGRDPHRRAARQPRALPHPGALRRPSRTGERARHRDRRVRHAGRDGRSPRRCTARLFGLLPIGWIVLNIIFLYQLTKDKGYFKILQDSIAGVTEDRRLQLLLIAFCFGAFFEGAAGFGTPVAVTGAILIGLGFSPLAASGLSLIANTAPVAYGALGTPIIALAAVTGLDLLQLSAMVGRQLPFFSLLVPFWLVWAFAGWRGMMEVWPAILVTGVSFAIPQFLISNFHGPWLVDVVAAIVSMAALTLFLRVWKPEDRVEDNRTRVTRRTAARWNGAGNMQPPGTTGHGRKGWVPWLVLSVFVFLWGVPGGDSSMQFAVTVVAWDGPAE